MTRAAVRKAEAAADAVLAWLDRQSIATVGAPDTAAGLPSTTSVVMPEARGADLIPADQAGQEAPDDALAGPIVRTAPLPRDSAEKDAAARAAAMAAVHTDWLFHHLDVSGPADDLRMFQAAACGAGSIPWHFDFDRMQEDLFLLLVAPSEPQQRTLSAAGARILAEDLRLAVARRHEIAVARVGVSQACPFDLHALLPAPPDILRLGPDHPDALAWLWTHWGTTQALRHVAVRQTAPDGARGSLAAGEARLRLSFWSADWTPWRALRQLRECWPLLRFEARPSYDAT